MNYGNRSPLPTPAGTKTTKSPPTLRSPLPSELGYGFAQPTPRSSNSNLPSSFRRPKAPPAAAPSTMRQPVHVQAQAQTQTQQPRRIELDYEVRDLLGRGTCGEVRRAIHRLTGKERAVKIISLPSPGLLRSGSNLNKKGKQEDETQQWRKEADILRQLKHPYVVELVDVFITETHLYLVMELCGKDLFDKVVEEGKYTETNSRRVMRRLLSAIHYIHEDCQLVHRDLKPENILLASANDPLGVKITDFGVAKSATSDGLKTFVGTPSYIAPEVLKRRHTVMARGRYGKSADMWSLGCILYILLSGTTPYSIDGAAGMDVVLQSSCKIGFPDSSWANISSEAKDLVNKLLIKDPNKRITVTQAMEHKWILKEDGDTHLHPLEDPKLIAVTKKRLFSPHMPNGPTPVTSAASPHCKVPKSKKRKVSMEKSEVVAQRPSSPLSLSIAPIQRPLSPVNRCGSPSASPPSSPSSFAKRLVVAKAANENDENRSEAESDAQVQRPKPVTVTKATQNAKQTKKDGLVKAAELEEDRIQSQFSDEEESISSFGNASNSGASSKAIVATTSTSAPVASSKQPANNDNKKPRNVPTKAVSSKANSKKPTGVTKKSKPSAKASKKASSKGSKSSDGEGAKITHFFAPVNKKSKK